MQSSTGRRAREFVGREEELRRIAILLREGARMITLTGPAGVGKTRLAEQASDEYARAAKAEVHRSPLTDVARDSDIDSVARHVLHSITRTSRSGLPAGAELVRVLSATRGERVVLVLDSCEHVLTGVSGLAAELIDSVPALTIIATSRENVGWVDEYLVVVPPLSTPDAVEVLRRRAERIGRPLHDDPAGYGVACVVSALPPGWSRWEELTPAESDVALLAAAGWANREIAVRRGASVRRVDAQLAAVRHKLMIASRGEIAQHVPDEIAQRMRRESLTRRRA
ncbi:AAA family ATPase [Nocardia sp. NPDC004568]|uniref:AAA family ATPase n=1 Tax=Nocardia sp. NPDC004568 TaxID=3154551 RepID=UPI0033B55DCA